MPAERGESRSSGEGRVRERQHLLVDHRDSSHSPLLFSFFLICSDDFCAFSDLGVFQEKFDSGSHGRLLHKRNICSILVLLFVLTNDVISTSPCSSRQAGCLPSQCRRDSPAASPNSQLCHSGHPYSPSVMTQSKEGTLSVSMTATTSSSST